MSQMFLIRNPDGRPRSVAGVPVKIKALPGWNFFARQENGWWWITEVRSGGLFPKTTACRTLEDTLREVERFCRKQGRAECERVFNIPISKFGDLTKVIEAKNEPHLLEVQTAHPQA
jgi:hypothetical protein